MRYRKHLAWGAVVSVGLGLWFVLVSLWAQSARQPSLEDRIAEAGERLKQQQGRVDRLRAEPIARTSPDLETPEELAQALQLAEAKSEARRQAIRKAEEERERAFNELIALMGERGRQPDSWPV